MRTTQRDARGYARIETRFPVRCRRASVEEVRHCEQRIAASDAAEEELPVALLAHLRGIEHKLALVLARLDPSVPEPLDPTVATDVVISGGGLLVESSDHDLRPDEAVLVELLLPTVPPRSVQAIGRVVEWIGENHTGVAARVAVDFTSIDEADRDAIVRLVNRLQLAAAHPARGRG
ncbi:PilZ domain-containing protein [Myxococcota bacterium]|nr:PilZ domain-containing protein [Myxococcota bacterium]